MLRALLLEDEPHARRLLVELIEETHLAEVVGVAASVTEALGLLLTVPVDVVFVDIRLPGGESGLDLIHRFGPSDGPGDAPRSGPFRRPLFVLATAVERHTLRAFELGVVDYLLKPLTEERVERCLRRLTGLLATRTEAPA